MPANALDMKSEATALLAKFSKSLLDLLGNNPESKELQSADPGSRCRSIISNACIKASVTAGGLALPPGPLGLLTILPDLVAIWKIQQNLVADIAATYGHRAILTRESMLYCLFRHAASQVVRDLVVRAGERVLVQRVSLRLFQQLLQKIGIKVLQRTTAKAISRWLPIVGAMGMAAYAWYDTAEVGKTAKKLFEKEVQVE